MFTGKVGENNINVLDALYTDEQLRKWSSKKIIKCPACDGDLIYKHGVIKIQHLAHEVSECNIGYFENETKEHMQGKTILYKWLLKQGKINNVHLEYWIPETKQRPDLYFEVDGIKCVIEFQCTPITVKEYRERHELYKLNNIFDIWILGKEKYDMNSDEPKHSDFKVIKNRYKTKALEKELITNNSRLYYLDVVKEIIYTDLHIVSTMRETIFNYNYIRLNINNCIYDELSNLFITEPILNKRIEHEKLIYKRLQFDKNFRGMILKLSNEIPKYQIVTRGIYNDGKYLYKIKFLDELKEEKYVFFIKDKKIEYSERYSYSTRCSYGFKKNYGYRYIYKKEYDELNEDVITNFILNIIN